VLPQIAAEELGIATDDVSCDPVDTKTVPNSGPTVASRTTMIVGGVIAACARAAREHLLHKISERHRIPRPELFLNEGLVRHQKSVLGSFPHLLKDLLAEEQRDAWTFTEQYQIPPQLSWDEKRHYGDAYAAYSWGCTVAEVAIDCNTYEIKVPRITTAMDIGRAINPLLAQGQMEGGTLQALGFTLTEEVGLKTDGTFLRDRFQTYILPTALDAPEMEVRIIEAPYSRGPGGAKGLGELPMHGTAPAIANAVEHALGVRIKDLPVTPEKILAAINASRNPCKGE
jgi:CO/xanthine dehydrogenase Mo-binding subunit